MRDDVSRKVWKMPGRGARLIVDLDVIEANVATIRRRVSPGTKVLAVVKASGYGDGGVQAAEAAVSGGASWLGVATVREGLELREAGNATAILVLGPTMAPETEICRKAGIDVAIGSRDQLREVLRNSGSSQALPMGVHLKIDTGMHRFGVEPAEAAAWASAIEKSGSLRLRGVFTHFARADETGVSATDLQATVFRQALNEIQQQGIDPGIVHASNSAATLLRRDLDFAMVRPGICIYGVQPGPEVPLFEGMRPALRVEAAIQRIAEIPPGEEVGYGGAFRSSTVTRIGLLSLGYADGYRRAFSLRSWAGFRGSRLRELGRVSMDQTVIELPQDLDIGYGDVVGVAGDGSWGEPTFEELAGIAGTIPYEILTAFGQRLPAYYIRNGDVVACDDAGCEG